MSRLLCLLLSLTVLSGCGFQLQRNYLFPSELSQISLVSPDEYGELHRMVKERLRLSNIAIVDTPDAPQLWLNNDRLERSTLSLFPSGQVAEFELIYSVACSITLPDKPVQQFDIQIRRDYLDDPRTALAKNRELERLLEEMRQEAADRIIRALSTTKV
jgi:LPS-assembly lipoprotein